MAEYYRSLDDADAYFEEQLFAADWTSQTDADKIKGLTQAARALDSLRWQGDKVPVFEACEANASATVEELEAADAEQAKKWPRDSADMVEDTPATVHTIAAWSTPPSNGNFTLTIEINYLDGTTTTFTTAAIAHDAIAATIETAIDVAATAAAVVAWVNGDITVAGGLLASSDVTLTFDGVSTTGLSHNVRTVVTADATYLIDGVLASPASTVAVTGEVPDRLFFAQCEEAISLLSGRDPKQEFENAVLTSDGVGSSRASSDRTQAAPAHTRHMFTSAMAWKYLAKFLDVKNADSFRFERK